VSLLALTRAVSPAMADCELTHLTRVEIDIERANAQHDDYERCLAEAGCRVEQLPAGADMPDAVFIEDTAVVFDELAVITRPGALSRRIETSAVAERLRGSRTIWTMPPSGALDGGDVLVVGQRVFVGRSSRSNQAGIDAMRTALEPYGYSVEGVDVHGCLHLKSAVTAVGDALLLMNAEWLPAATFAGFDRIDVDPAEPMAANALRVRRPQPLPDSIGLTSTPPSRWLRTRCASASRSSTRRRFRARRNVSNGADCESTPWT
jgi:dimethylargininase